MSTPSTDRRAFLRGTLAAGCLVPLAARPADPTSRLPSLGSERRHLIAFGQPPADFSPEHPGDFPASLSGVQTVADFKPQFSRAVEVVAELNAREMRAALPLRRWYFVAARVRKQKRRPRPPRGHFAKVVADIQARSREGGEA